MASVGKNYYAKMMSVDEIMIDPVISQVFIYKQQMADEISKRIKADGYDKSQPLTLVEGKKYPARQAHAARRGKDGGAYGSSRR